MRLGIDLGGTKIEIIALDDSGKELLRRRVATPKNNYYETLQAIAQLVRNAEAELGQRGSLGIGTPGALSRATGRLKNSNSVALNGQPILQDLEALLQRKIKISNDANCFALSEATDGAAAGTSVVFGVILGTGIGAGIVVNGHILTGSNGIAGEWGHNPLPWPQAHELPGPLCYCGKQGCIETFLSGPGMMQLHQESVRAEPVEAWTDSQLSTGSGRTELCSPAEIVQRAEQCDAACKLTSIASRADLRTSSTSSTLTSSCWAAACPTSNSYTRTCPRCGASGCFQIGWIRGWCSIASAIPAG